MASDNNSTAGRRGIITASAIIALALVFCTAMVSSTMVKVKGFGRTISVTGAAVKPIVSDYAIWEGEISSSASQLDAAYDKIKRDLVKTESFLKKEGFSSQEYEIGSVQVTKDIDYRTQTLVGYTLRQKIRLEMADVGRITSLSRKASSLVEQGVEFNSSTKYLFTGLDELKVEMIRKATENAKLRAAQLAETTDRAIGAPTSARVGVFQIRPRHSQEVSAMGISDVTSVEKEIVCTVHVSFLID